MEFFEVPTMSNCDLFFVFIDITPKKPSWDKYVMAASMVKDGSQGSVLKNG